MVISAAIETNDTIFNSFWQLLNPGKAVQVGDSIGWVDHTVESLRLQFYVVLQCISESKMCNKCIIN